MHEGTGEVIFRALSRTFSGESRRKQEQEQWRDEDPSDSDSVKTKVEPWRLEESVKQMQLSDRAESRRLGVTWRDLTVQVVPSDSRLQENVLSQFNMAQQIKESRIKRPLKTILDSSYGCVKPGEMLLVLGRPGEYNILQQLHCLKFRHFTCPVSFHVFLRWVRDKPSIVPYHSTSSRNS